MLQSLRNIASSSQSIAEINRTIWTQLDDNELYVAARPDTLTVLCFKQEPTEIEIEGTGKLKLHRNCKAYGTRVFIQAQTVVSFNNSEKDIIPPLSLKYDCCNFAIVQRTHPQEYRSLCTSGWQTNLMCELCMHKDFLYVS